MEQLIAIVTTRSVSCCHYVKVPFFLKKKSPFSVKAFYLNFVIKVKCIINKGVNKETCTFGFVKTIPREGNKGRLGYNIWYKYHGLLAVNYFR